MTSASTTRYSLQTTSKGPLTLIAVRMIPFMQADRLHSFDGNRTARSESIHGAICDGWACKSIRADVSERQKMVEKAEGVLNKMRAKTEKYDETRQKVISSVAQRPSKKHKYCTLL